MPPTEISAGTTAERGAPRLVVGRDALRDLEAGVDAALRTSIPCRALAGGESSRSLTLPGGRSAPRAAIRFPPRDAALADKNILCSHGMISTPQAPRRKASS